MMKNSFICLISFLSINFQGFAKSFELNSELISSLKEKLNSERIEYLFGSYGVETMNVSASNYTDSRISNLYSTHDGKKVMRTFAIVDFVKPLDLRLQEADRKIKNGGSIGTVLKQLGWTIVKNPIFFGEIELAESVKSLMQTSKHQGVIQIYQLVVNHNGQKSPSIPYCTIIEIHSPEYLNREWFESLYPDDFTKYSVISDKLVIMLDQVFALMKEIK